MYKLELKCVKYGQKYSRKFSEKKNPCLLFGAIHIPTELLDHTLADLHGTQQGVEKMQAQAREAVYWPSIDADINDYVHMCTICTRPPHWHNQCFPKTSPMAHGRRSQLTTSTTKVKSTCSYANCSASTLSYPKFPPH